MKYFTRKGKIVNGFTITKSDRPSAEPTLTETDFVLDQLFADPISVDDAFAGRAGAVDYNTRRGADTTQR